jgi:hypothetical protein
VPRSLIPTGSLMPATLVLPIANTAGESATFTLTGDTLVWVHGSAGNDAMVGVDIKGSDGVFSELASMSADGITRSGVLPAGEYKVTRIRGKCGFQRAA